MDDGAFHVTSVCDERTTKDIERVPGGLLRWAVTPGCRGGPEAEHCARFRVGVQCRVRVCLQHGAETSFRAREELIEQLHGWREDVRVVRADVERLVQAVLALQVVQGTPHGL